MTAQLLMCAPGCFQVSYVINPWMQGQVATENRVRARRQWTRLHQVLSSVSNVSVIEPVPGLPDMVFTANAGTVLGRQVVLSRFRHDERRGEEPHFARWFADHGLCVQTLGDDVTFEGAGDALLDRSQPLLWMGHGHRTDAHAAPLLADTLDIEVQPLELVDPRFYHLDTCFCPLPGGELMYHPAAFAEASQRVIEARVPPSRRIVVGDTDARAFACNAVAIERRIVLNRASPALGAELARHGFEVTQVALGEFIRAGGAAKCLTLRIDEPRAGSMRQAA